MRVFTRFFHIFLLLGILTLPIFTNKGTIYAATCAEWDCTKTGIDIGDGGGPYDEYKCQNNTYCCAGPNGCPSTGCSVAGYVPTNECIKDTWACCLTGPPTCTYCSTSAYYETIGYCYACAGVGGNNGGCTTTAPSQVTLVSPSNGSILINKPSVALSWNSLSGWGENCDGNTTKKYKVQVDPGTGWEDVCTVDNPTSTCAFAADSTTNKTYKWRVIADNGAKTSTSAEWAFTVNMKTDITVTVQEIPTSTTTCPTTPVRNLAGASVTVSVWGAQTEDNKTFTDTTGTDGKITLSVPYSTATPPQITVCPTYSDGMCQTYGIKCSESNLNSTLQTCATVAQNTAVASQTVTMQMAKVTKDPWVAVVDGDAYAGSFTNTGPCTSETSSDSGFYLGMLNLNKLQEGSLGSNIYALSVRGSSFSTDISEGPLGGFIQNIGVEDSASQKIELKAPEGAKVMTNLGGYLRPDVYKISIADFNNSSWQYYFLSQNLGLVESQYYGTSTDTYFGAKCYPGDVNYRPGFLGDCSPKPTRLLTCIGTTCYVRTGNISPRVAFVYVEGNPSNTLVIDRPINSIEVPGAPLGVSTSPGNVVIITRAHVKIDPSLSTPLSTYTIDTPPQIEAIIISSSGIEVGSNYTEASPDNPVVFYGSLISTKSGSASGKGLQILRDLGLNNNMYPSAVVHYPLGTLDRVTKSIKFNSRWGVETGLEIFDVQYEFDDDAGEIGN